jgi:tetratricopeptide (TPR) repeat protein
MKRPHHGIAAVLLSLSLIAARGRAQDDHDKMDHHDAGHAPMLGHVAFANSGNQAAQKPFLEGLALIHSFEYSKAVDAFQRAEKADPSFALPYWAEALTNTQIIWGIDDPAAARKVLARLGPTREARLAKVHRANERAFASAVEAFYADGPQEARVHAFADSLRRWATAMPTDQEANAFAALGILWEADFVQGENASKLKAEAIKHAQYVFDRNPLHPGAAHYIIHASDSPAMASQGLKAAREYSRIAPDAEHALHMPSHIFLPLGMWDDLMTSNRRSWAASRAEEKRKNLPGWYNDFHSLNWLQYAYLQTGRWKDAAALIDTAKTLTAGMRGKVAPSDDPDGTFVVEQLAFRYGAETGDWKYFPSDQITINMNDSTVSGRAKGMGATSMYEHATVAAIHGDTVYGHNAAESVRSAAPRIAMLIDIGLVIARNNCNETIAALEKVRPQTRVDRYTSMTPSSGFVIPTLLGDALTGVGRYREAIDVYKEALTDRPGTAAALLGLARAQDGAGDTAGARATRAQLSAIWKHADPGVRALLNSGGRTCSK